MDVTESAGVVARVVVAVVLVTSSAAKLRSPTAFTALLGDLGLRRPRPWWLAVCVMELLVAISTIVPVSAAIAASMIVFVGVAFAGAGLRALTFDRPLRCVCFGTGHSWRLGWAQVALLPVWLLVAIAVTWWQPSGGGQRAALATTVLLFPLTVYAVQLLRAINRARADRLAVAK